jgi:hypothetical protein
VKLEVEEEATLIDDVSRGGRGSVDTPHHPKDTEGLASNEAEPRRPDEEILLPFDP